MEKEVIFRSEQRFLRVGFPPEQYGFGTDVEGKLAPYPHARFDHGVYRTKSERMIDLLRTHKGNESNGGDAFWEEKAKVSESFNSLKDGDVIIGNRKFADEKEFIQMVNELKGFANKLIPTKAEDACERTGQLIENLKIIGFKKPTPDLGIKRIQARLTELLGVLEDNRIIGGDNDGT